MRFVNTNIPNVRHLVSRVVTGLCAVHNVTEQFKFVEGRQTSLGSTQVLHRGSSVLSGVEGVKHRK